MKIPENIASTLQDALYLTSLDGYCPDLFIGERVNERPENSSILWKNSVELIYRCLTSNLLEIDSRWAEAMQMVDPEIFSKKLAQHDPFDLKDFNENGAVYWLESLLYATAKLKILLSKYKINELGMDVCTEFIDEVLEMFKKTKPLGERIVYFTNCKAWYVPSSSLRP